MSGWWRRNAVGVIAVAVLVPLSAVVVVGNEWKEYFLYDSTYPAQVANDGTVELAETTWGPVRAVDITGSEGLENPEGTKVIAVAIPVDPHDVAPGCGSPVLVERSTGREWVQRRDELGIPWTVDEHVACVLPEKDDDGEPLPIDPYEILVAYVVPEDAGPFWVDVSPTPAIPSFARFVIDPS
ncbi:hypothetical protein ACWGJP_07915 [Microbacterium sp. NPDC055903]